MRTATGTARAAAGTAIPSGWAGCAVALLVLVACRPAPAEDPASYFIWDPVHANQPAITFSIRDAGRTQDDNGNPYHYRWDLYIGAPAEDPNAEGQLHDTVTGPGQVTVDTALRAYLQNQPPGIYGFDIKVTEVETGDVQWQKRPYKLGIEVLDVYLREGATGADPSLWVQYRLNDDRDATELWADVYFSDWTHCGPISLSTQHGVIHDTLLTHLDRASTQPGRIWVVVHGTDGHGTDFEPANFREYQHHRALVGGCPTGS